MTTGQTFYNLGQFGEAAAVYESAYYRVADEQEPDWLNITRAARGVFEAKHRIGDEPASVNPWRARTLEAVDSTVTAAIGRDEWEPADLLELDQQTVQGSREALREVIQTKTVVHKVDLRDLIRTELETGTIDANLKDATLTGLEVAGNLLPLVEGNGPIDQYRINWESPGFFGQCLYGSRAEAREIARQARRHWRLSESPELPTAANISEEYTAKAQRRARLRAMAMTGSLVLPRYVVLNVANKVV